MQETARPEAALELLMEPLDVLVRREVGLRRGRGGRKRRHAYLVRHHLHRLSEVERGVLVARAYARKAAAANYFGVGEAHGLVAEHDRDLARPGGLDDLARRGARIERR